MAYDWLKGVADEYDVIVIGSGLGGLTGANVLAKAGHRVLLVEHHYQFGGLATRFTRKGGHIFDISLHGFPSGMIKSCRRYWTKEISDAIVQLKDIRFVNPQMDVWTTFTRDDYTRVLVEQFKLPRAEVEAFYDYLRAMNYYDNNPETTGQMLNRFFPGRPDVHRLLMEPISYANGSNFDDPAITFGIVFSNFMGAGVYTFRGGSDVLIEKMVDELKKNGVELRKKCSSTEFLSKSATDRKSPAASSRPTAGSSAPRPCCPTPISRTRSSGWPAPKNFSADFVAQAQAVRINTSSCQVYFGIRKGESIPHIGDLVFTSAAPHYSNEELTDFHTTSRTFSVYYPDTRPGSDRYTVVASLNGRYPHWKSLSEEGYELHKRRHDRGVAGRFGEIYPRRARQDRLAWRPLRLGRSSAIPPTSIGTSFGTKFEGLPVSMNLSEKLPGLFHAGSVGIIMCGLARHHQLRRHLNPGQSKVDKQSVRDEGSRPRRGSPVTPTEPSHRPHSAPSADFLRR